MLLLTETVYFTCRCAGAILRLRGERTFFSMDLPGSWRNYQAALEWGGERDRIETDEAELLLFGLDQIETGMKITAAFPAKESIQRTFDLVAGRLRESPGTAYHWSLAADSFLQVDALRLRETTLDLATLSENPLDNFSPARWRAIAALETASHLEPYNYIYQDMLVDLFLEVGRPIEAAPYCRRAVASYPVTWEHKYLLGEDLDPILLEAAIQGFEDARARPSLVPRGAIESDAGRFLADHGKIERAIPYLEDAVRSDPDLYEAHFYLGAYLFGLKRYDEASLRMHDASRIHPDSPDPNYYLGLCEMQRGDLRAAIEEFQGGREKDPALLKLFFALGDALEKADRLDEAERQFVAATNVHPESIEAWGFLLDFYHRRHDARGETRSCAEVLSRKPIADVLRPRCTGFDLDIHP